MITKSIWRGVVALLSFGIPIVFTTFPQWETLTIGTVAFAILHFLEKKFIAL